MTRTNTHALSENGDALAHYDVWDGTFLNDDEESEQRHEEGTEQAVLTDLELHAGSTSPVQASEDAIQRADGSNSQDEFNHVTPTREHQDALVQTQSILFTLPYEIRAKIWMNVVGGGLVHITELRSLLGHVPCMDHRDQWWGLWQHDCWLFSLKVYRTHISPATYGDKEAKPGSLGLLRSCHRLYSDAINVLYEANTFCFRSLDTLQVFLESLTSDRLEHITSLYLAPMVHSNYKTWEHTWTTLACMPNLRCLRVELRGGLKEREPSAKAKLLQLMCCVEQTDVYQVKVPWELEEIRDWIWACPFTLEGTYGEVIENGEKEYVALLRRERIGVREWLKYASMKGTGI